MGFQRGHKIGYIDGRTGHPLWRSWIQVEREGCSWPTWTEYIAWAEPRHTKGAKLVRKDTNLPFSPDNCIFSDEAARVISGKVRSDNKTGFKGVFWDESKQRYTVSITVNRKTHALGNYRALDDAVAARRRAESKYYPELMEVEA